MNVVVCVGFADAPVCLSTRLATPAGAVAPTFAMDWHKRNTTEAHVHFCTHAKIDGKTNNRESTYPVKKRNRPNRQEDPTDEQGAE